MRATLPPANAPPTGVYMLAGDAPYPLIRLGGPDAGQHTRRLEAVARMFRLYRYGNGSPDQQHEWPKDLRKTIHPTGFFTLAGGSVLVVPAVRTEECGEDGAAMTRCVDLFLFSWGQGELVKDDTE